jgi:membrane-bound lytic murein transglycosylase MltF
VYQAQTGFPFTVSVFGDTANAGTVVGENPIRANVTSQKVFPSGTRNSTTWMNPTAFVTPPAYTYGNAGRNSVYGPGLQTMDLGVVREFHMAERAVFEARAEFFNALNHTQFYTVNAGLVPLTLSDSLTAEFWAKVFPDLHLYPGLPLTDTGATGWAFRKGSPQLTAVVNEFVAGHREGTAFGNTILRKYLGNTKWAKNAIAEQDLHRFEEMVKLFRKYGTQNNLPYLLVAAQAYQESGLDQDVRSPVGAVGVMQIKPSTAAGKPIEVNGVDQLENNIKAGTKYLRFLVDRYYADEPMDRVTKGLFAIASYNAGPARIQQLRRKAQAQGLDPNRWFNNVELVAARRLGRETVQYVSNISKYYIAYRLLEEQRAEREAARKGAAGK